MLGLLYVTIQVTYNSWSGLRANGTTLAGSLSTESEKVVELVREPPSRSYRLSLSGMLPDLAMRCLYRVLVFEATILKRSDSVIFPVLSVTSRRTTR